MASVSKSSQNFGKKKTASPASPAAPKIVSPAAAVEDQERILKIKNNLKKNDQNGNGHPVTLPPVVFIKNNDSGPKSNGQVLKNGNDLSKIENGVKVNGTSKLEDPKAVKCEKKEDHSGQKKEADLLIPEKEPVLSIPKKLPEQEHPKDPKKKEPQPKSQKVMDLPKQKLETDRPIEKKEAVSLIPEKKTDPLTLNKETSPGEKAEEIQSPKIDDEHPTSSKEEDFESDDDFLMISGPIDENEAEESLETSVESEPEKEEEKPLQWTWNELQLVAFEKSREDGFIGSYADWESRFAIQECQEKPFY